MPMISIEESAQANPAACAPPCLSATGSRRMSLAMLEVRDRADQFAGLAAGTAKPLRILAAFQEAEPYLGLPAQAFKLVSWLVKQTMPQDWETGSRPICWPSARLQQEFLGLSAARVKALNRALFEAGIFVIRDNEQGKRYGRRGPDKRIIEAYGFDLSPLAQRYDEFVRIAAEARAERERAKAQRKRITIARRAVSQAAELLATLGLPLLACWVQLLAETAELVAAGRKAYTSEDLALVAKALENRQAQAEQWLKEASSPVNINPTGVENEPHIISTNESLNLKDTVIATEGSSCFDIKPKMEAPAPAKTVAINAHRGVAGIRKPHDFIELFPRVEQYIVSDNPGWAEIVGVAGGPLRQELGISMTLWGEACQVMGREAAAVALAIVSVKAEGYFTKGAAGYFAGMVRRAKAGELHLERTLWALREAKWGKPASRKLN